MADFRIKQMLYENSNIFISKPHTFILRPNFGNGRKTLEFICIYYLTHM